MSSRLKKVRMTRVTLLGGLCFLSAVSCSFDDRDVRVRPGIVPPGDGDSDPIGDGDGDLGDELEEACSDVLNGLAGLFLDCAGAYVADGSCPGTTEADIDALLECSDEAFAGSCESFEGSAPSDTPTCDSLLTEGKLEIILAQ